MNNKKSGNKFERDLCNKFFENGIWSRLEYPAEDGSQPFDVKAIYRHNIYVFECKDCKNGYFDLSRIEDNQQVALELLSENMLSCNILFAFQFGDEWLFVEADDILYELNFERKKRLKKEDIKKMHNLTFEELVKWMKSKGAW